MNLDAVSDLEVGKAAEHLVVADLILSGYRAYLTEQGLPYDVVIDYERRLYRVQVKASRAPKKMPQQGAVGNGYLYNVRRAGKGGRRVYLDDEFDIVALVGMDIRIVAYLPFKGLQTIYLRPPGHVANPSTQRTRTIDQFPIEVALASITGRRPVLTPNCAQFRLLRSSQENLFEIA